MSWLRDLQPGDKLHIGESTIAIEHKTGQRIRVRVDSPLEIALIKAGSELRPAMKQPPMQPTQQQVAPAASPDTGKRPRLTMPPAAKPA